MAAMPVGEGWKVSPAADQPDFIDMAADELERDWTSILGKAARQGKRPGIS
jgi:hypothetical protein